MFDKTLVSQSEEILEICRGHGLKLAAAESCTGGLIAALFTEVAGSSDVFERGFVTYSNTAKMEMLGVPGEELNNFGAVSAEVARSMAAGALSHSDADLSVAVTGIAGPGGGSEEKPVGLVYIGVARKDGPVSVKRFEFGDIGRHMVRQRTVEEALKLLKALVAQPG